jgi:hypothetical protein
MLGARRAAQADLLASTSSEIVSTLGEVAAKASGSLTLSALTFSGMQIRTLTSFQL